MKRCEIVAIYVDDKLTSVSYNQSETNSDGWKRDSQGNVSVNSDEANKLNDLYKRIQGEKK